MRIRIADIGSDGLRLDILEEARSFPVLQELEQAGEARFQSPLKVVLRAVLVGDLVEVSGRVETDVELSCSRCLATASTAIQSEFDLSYVRELPEICDESGEDGCELSAEDLGLILFSGDDIELGEAIQEQVILALPFHPLCSEDCRGLCPSCGANLNVGDCGCAAQDFNIKFAALKNLKVDK